MPKHTLYDDFEYKGLWWLPQSPDNKVAGVVAFDGERITLDLLGLLRAGEKPASSEERHPDIILGRAEGKAITLSLTVEIESTVPWSDTNRDVKRGIPHTSAYDAQHIFIGKHFESPDQARFTAMSASFTYLEEWMGLDKIPFKSTIEEGWNQSAKYTRPEPIHIEVRALDSRIAINSRFAIKGEMFRSMTWEHTAMIAVVPKEERDLDWYENRLDDLQRLFTLLVGRPVHVASLELHVQGEFREVHNGGLQMPVAYVSASRSRTLREEVRPPVWRWHWRDVLVPLGSIESDIEHVLNAWFDQAEKLGPIHNLFFGTLYNRTLHEEAKFLNLMQALESYHARTAWKDRYVPDEEYKEHQKAMLSELPENIRQILAPRLPFLNRYSLKTRLDKLLYSLGFHTVKATLVEDMSTPSRTVSRTRAEMAKALNKVTRQLTDTRNYLTHYDEKGKKRALTEGEIIETNPKLQLWLIAMLLDDAGIDNVTIAKAIDRFAEKNLVIVSRH